MNTHTSLIADRILNAAQNRTLTFFVGAGVSAISGAPTWKNLINTIKNELGFDSDDLKNMDFTQIAQMLYLKKGHNEYLRFIYNTLNNQNLKPNLIHEKLFSLKPSSFITTNFDCLLEQCAFNLNLNYKCVCEDKEVSNINGQRCILKIHGDLKHQNIVFKEEDFFEYSDNFKLIETILKAIFAINTVVFIGYSLSDHNIKTILNSVKRQLKDSFNKPIFIYTSDQTLTDDLVAYHNYRGLSVISASDLYTGSDRYIRRYCDVLDRIKKER